MFVIIIDPMLTAMYNSIDLNKVTKRLCTQFLNIGCFKQDVSRCHEKTEIKSAQVRILSQDLALEAVGQCQILTQNPDLS